MYAKNMQPIPIEKLELEQFITLQENQAENGPLIKFLFSLDTPYLQKDFNLDLIIRNLSKDKMEITEKVVHYVLNHFSKLFETGWTALYYHLCNVDPDTEEHTLKEFYEEQIDFESSYYTIQLEINCDHLSDGTARYCFVVSTTCDCYRWMISDDDMRVYMMGNKACGFNTNNDDGQMLEDLESCSMFYGMGGMLAEIYHKMEMDGFQYAEPF